MPEISPHELRERLNRDLPGAAVMPEPAASESSAEEESGAKPKGKHEEKPTAGHPAPTNDTLVVAERLPDIVYYLRDQLGYAFLSDIAVVDYLEAGVFELVYFFYHPVGGGDLKIKVRVPRDKPDVPSMTPFWPGANLMEREGFDLYGINFIGHPYPMRIYMWDELDVYPMRKDFPKQGDKYLDEE